MSGDLVAEDGDPVDGAAVLKMLLNLLRRRAVVHVSDVNRSTNDPNKVV